MRQLRRLSLFLLLTGLCFAQRSAKPTSPPSVSDVVKSSSDSVVLITASDASGKTLRIGSGFIVSSDGKIVTNYHVIRGASSATVKLASGAFFPVDGIVALDEAKDLAVLKVSGTNLPALRLGDSDTVLLGEHVVAIGNPYGLQGSISDGIVSGIRELEPGASFIQTTAPVSAGNSGGPLLRMSGEALGVIEWQVDPSRSENLNFAVPINAVKPLLAREHLEQFGAALEAAQPERAPGTEPPTIEEILAKNLQAIGGKTARERNILSVVTKSSFDFRGVTATKVTYSKAPNKLVVVVDIPGYGQRRDGFDGYIAWEQIAQLGVRLLTGQELGMARRAASWLKLRETYQTLTFKGIQVVGERPAYVIEGDPGDGSHASWYFDVDTGLLVRSDVEYDTVLGHKSTSSYFSDYRDVSGMKRPFTVRVSTPTGDTTFRVLDVSYDVPIDESLFAKPQGPPVLEVVNSNVGSRPAYLTLPGTPATANTYCSGGAYSANCTTTINPGTPPTTYQYSIAQVWVQAVLDGRHVTLWCQKEFRDCRPMQSGQYAAELEGDAVWVTSYEVGGKAKRIKYKLVGSW